MYDVIRLLPTALMRRSGGERNWPCSSDSYCSRGRMHRPRVGMGYQL